MYKIKTFLTSGSGCGGQRDPLGDGAAPGPDVDVGGGGSGTRPSGRPSRPVVDDLHVLAGEEAHLEAPLPSPPGGLLRRRHVDHTDHVAYLKL